MTQSSENNAAVRDTTAQDIDQETAGAPALTADNVAWFNPLSEDAIAKLLANSTSMRRIYRPLDSLGRQLSAQQHDAVIDAEDADDTDGDKAVSKPLFEVKSYPASPAELDACIEKFNPTQMLLLETLVLKDEPKRTFVLLAEDFNISRHALREAILGMMRPLGIFEIKGLATKNQIGKLVESYSAYKARGGKHSSADLEPTRKSELFRKSATKFDVK